MRLVLIAAMMELTNELQHAHGPSRAEATEKLLLMLAPFAPYIIEELWERRGGTESVHRQSWPVFDPAMATLEEITLIVQVDGKVRDRINARAGLPESELQKIALASQKAKAALDGRTVDRTIIVPDRLVNIVTRRSP